MYIFKFMFEDNLPVFKPNVDNGQYLNEFVETLDARFLEGIFTSTLDPYTSVPNAM